MKIQDRLKRPKLPKRIQLTKRSALASAVILTLILATVIALLLYDKKDESPEVDASKYGTNKTACEIFPQKEADWLLNETTNKQKDSSVNPSIADTQATTCVYVSTSGEPGSKKITYLTIQSPTTEGSIETLKQAFNAAKQGDIREVSGYEQGAYWDYSKNELNFLARNVWYTAGLGKEGTISDRTLGDTQEMADLLSM